MTSTQPVLDEDKLVHLASAGDQTAFDSIVIRFQQPVYDICYRLLDDAMAAEDATQEVFIRAYIKRHTYDPSYKYATWLFAIATHYCLDRLKKRRLRQISIEDLPEGCLSSEDQRTPEEIVIAVETQHQVQALVATLPLPYHQPIWAKYCEGRSCREIAKQLNLSVNGVKSRLFRGRKMMSETLLS